MRLARPLILLLAGGAWPVAHAQPIYRCGDSYSQQPCPGATQVATTPAPSAADRAQAAAATSRDARLAQEMERERTRREAQAAASAYVPPTDAPPAPDEHRWPEKAGTRKLDVFTATTPRPPRHKKEPKAAKASGSAGRLKMPESVPSPRAAQPVPLKTAAGAGAG
ncbi:MAG: hypothetical protein ACXWC2_08265 [Ramlibacter sp.]